MRLRNLCCKMSSCFSFLTLEIGVTCIYLCDYPWAVFAKAQSSLHRVKQPTVVCFVVVVSHYCFTVCAEYFYDLKVVFPPTIPHVVSNFLSLWYTDLADVYIFKLGTLWFIWRHNYWCQTWRNASPCLMLQKTWKEIICCECLVLLLSALPPRLLFRWVPAVQTADVCLFELPLWHCLVGLSNWLKN